jgi:hypothetical protein
VNPDKSKKRSLVVVEDLLSEGEMKASFYEHHASPRDERERILFKIHVKSISLTFIAIDDCQWGVGWEDKLSCPSSSSPSPHINVDGELVRRQAKRDVSMAIHSLNGRERHEARAK